MLAGAPGIIESLFQTPHIHRSNFAGRCRVFGFPPAAFGVRRGEVVLGGGGRKREQEEGR